MLVGRVSQLSSRHTRQPFAVSTSLKTVRACAVLLTIRPSRYDFTDLVSGAIDMPVSIAFDSDFGYLI